MPSPATRKSSSDGILGSCGEGRINFETGPLRATEKAIGLSIPSYPPDGVFWDPEADAAFMETLRADLRPDIPILEYEQHINDSAFGVEVAELFLEIIR